MDVINGDAEDWLRGVVDARAAPQTRPQSIQLQPFPSR